MWPYYNEDDQWNPILDLYGDAIRCGRDAFSAAPNTKTATLIAGEPVGFQTNNPVSYTDVLNMRVSAALQQSKSNSCVCLVCRYVPLRTRRNISVKTDDRKPGNLQRRR
jgi:hypothetical protein